MHGTNVCRCECQDAFFGELCDVQVQLPTKELKSGEKFTFRYDQTGAKALKKGDRISVFSASVTPWTKEKGWAKIAVPNIEVTDDMSFEKEMALYDEGHYNFVMIEWLGMNEFNVNKGFATFFKIIGTVTVASCGANCAPAPPVCFDKGCGGDNPPYNCVDGKSMTTCNRFKSRCYSAKKIQFRSGDTLAALCPKSCAICGDGPKPVAPPPPVPPPGTGPVVTACVPKASLGKCAQCLTNDQCGRGGFCCPYMKKCVISSKESCTLPIANCRPMCYDSTFKRDQCKCASDMTKKTAHKWQKPTCNPGQTPKIAPTPAQTPTPSPTIPSRTRPQPPQPRPRTSPQPSPQPRPRPSSSVQSPLEKVQQRADALEKENKQLKEKVQQLQGGKQSHRGKQTPSTPLPPSPPTTPEPSPAVPSVQEISLKGKKTSQVSTSKHGGESSRAIDGNTDSDWKNGSCTMTRRSRGPWWKVDLGSSAKVISVLVFNRADCCGSRLNSFQVRVGNKSYPYRNGQCGTNTPIKQGESKAVDCAGRMGRYVSVMLPRSKRDILTLCEVKVFGIPGKAPNLSTRRRRRYRL